MILLCIIGNQHIQELFKVALKPILATITGASGLHLMADSIEEVH